MFSSRRLAQPYYALEDGRTSVPPGRYFACTWLVISRGSRASEALLGAVRIRIRCAIFYGWRTGKSSRSLVAAKTRGRLPHEVTRVVFGWVLKLVAEQGLVKGQAHRRRCLDDGSQCALRTIVRRDDGRTYREMLTKMAKESGDRDASGTISFASIANRKGKKLSNEEWTSKTDQEAKIAGR